MTATTKSQINSASSEPTVHMRWMNNCLLVDDKMPVELLSKLGSLFPKGAVIDTHLARLAGSVIAVGMPKNTERLAKMLEPAMRANIDKKYPSLASGAKEWLVSGHHGSSSIWLFSLITGIVLPSIRAGTTPNPLDPSDLMRVVTMLRKVQGTGILPEVAATASPEWKALHTVWPTLVSMLDEEMNHKSSPGKSKATKSTPKTYELMRHTLASVHLEGRSR